jgi:hypothetical protein
MLFNDRRANARALKAANGPGLSPAGYERDDQSRYNVRRIAADERNLSLKNYPKPGRIMSKKEAIGRGVDAHEFYEKNPEELNAGNRYRAENDQNPITMNIPKNKKKGK